MKKSVIISFILFCFASCSPYNEVRIPFEVKGVPDSSRTLQAFIYYPDDKLKHDVVIYNHGSSCGNPKEVLPSEKQAGYFVRQGYICVVPMRKGRGKSDGISEESEIKNCNPDSWEEGIDSAMDDVSSAIAYVKRMSRYSGSKIIIAGASRGGYLSVAYASKGKYRDDISAVVNFVGGWVAQAEDQCSLDFNSISFERFGKLTKKYSIWMYSNNDTIYASDSIREYFDKYHTGNKNSIFFMYSTVPTNGHFLPQYEEIWGADVTKFLKGIK
ncbi:MAG TPA: dienelactone hydrolase family protein [Spirochaetota bacterium]